MDLLDIYWPCMMHIMYHTSACDRKHSQRQFII